MRVYDQIQLFVSVKVLVFAITIVACFVIDARAQSGNCHAIDFRRSSDGYLYGFSSGLPTADEAARVATANLVSKQNGSTYDVGPAKASCAGFRSLAAAMPDPNPGRYWVIGVGVGSTQDEADKKAFESCNEHLLERRGDFGGLDPICRILERSGKGQSTYSEGAVSTSDWVEVSDNFSVIMIKNNSAKQWLQVAGILLSGCTNVAIKCGVNDGSSAYNGSGQNLPPNSVGAFLMVMKRESSLPLNFQYQFWVTKCKRAGCI